MINLEVLRSRDSALRLRLPRRSVSFVATTDGSSPHPKDDHESNGKCRETVIGDAATIYASETDLEPRSSHWACDQIRIYAYSEKALSEYAYSVQKVAHDAYASSNFTRFGNWLYVKSHRTAFFDPALIAFRNNIWLTYDGIVIDAVLGESFLLTNWIALGLRVPDFPSLSKVYESSIEFIKHYRVTI